MESKAEGNEVTIPEFEYSQFFKNYNRYVCIATIRAEELLRVKNAGYLRNRKLQLGHVTFTKDGIDVSLDMIGDGGIHCGTCVETLSSQQLSMTEWTWADYLKEQGKWNQN